jgi:uncharacterized protein (DUF2252 family)
MDDVCLRINEFNQHRIAKMVAMKYEGMSENMFRFFRGTNHLFYEDLKSAGGLPPSPLAWICGDLHLENFGSFKSDKRLVYFDLNDFDEALLAPVCWEVVRMVTSIFVAFESLGIDQKKAMNMARLFIKTYAAVLSGGKPDYLEPQTAKGIVYKFLTEVSQRKQKEILAKRTVLHKNKLEMLLDDPRHFELEKELKKALSDHINHWLKTDGNSPYNYKVTDAVFRLAGTGSVGVKRYALLLKSLNDEGEKYMLIDMKQSVPSALLPYLANAQPSWDSEADRIVEIQKMMQNRPPALLSTTNFLGDPFVVQEMQPTKDSINFKMIKKQYRDMYQVIDDMAMLTASSQLRSSGRKGSAIADELIVFGQSADWREPLLNYAIDYAHRVKKDYMLFLKDFKAGIFGRKKVTVALPDENNIMAAG